jgi:hypothetical protein
MSALEVFEFARRFSRPDGERGHPPGFGPGRRSVRADAPAGGRRAGRRRLTRLPDIARAALDGFFEGDRLQPALGEIAEAALNFPAPTTPSWGRGPAVRARAVSRAYRGLQGFGARFLAESLQRLESGRAP